MKKPEYLTRECKTFLELLKWSIDEHQMPEFDRLVEVTNFYSQPFTKDMIVHPNKKEMDKYQNGIKYITEDEARWQPLFKGEWAWLNRHYVDYKTPDGKGQILVSNIGSVDDFIREGKKVGIKLEWK